MIGALKIDEPDWPDEIAHAVDEHGAAQGQDYASMQAFGLWGAADNSPRLRLYAGYQHVKAQPGDGAAWLELANLHRELGEADKAAAILQEVERAGGLGLFPGVFQEDLAVHLAYVCADAGRLDDALAQLLALRERYDHLPIYHYVVATILHEQQRFDEATPVYALAIQTLREGADEIAELIDVDALARVLERFRKSAAEQKPFAGARPLEMSVLSSLEGPDGV